jgi:hypothetical protein
MVTFRARFDGKVLIPESAAPNLPTDRSLEVQVNDASVTAEPEDALRPGSPAAILRLMRSLPPIPREDVDELERLIKEGQSPPDYRGAFDEPGNER